MPSTSSSDGPVGSISAGSPGVFNCPAGVLPASNPLLDGSTVSAGTASQISNYRVPQYDAPDPSYVIDGVNYWWREGYSPPSAGPVGSISAGSPGVFNCPAGVLPASNPLLDGSTVSAGTASQISNYRVPQYDVPDPSYVIDGVNYWWREGYAPPSIPDNEPLPRFLLEGNLLPAGTSPSAAFGSCVAISADGNTTVVGSTGQNNQAGLSVFVRTTHSGGGSSWSQQGPQLPGGRSVAISWDGDVILAGDPADANNTGAAWAFTRTAGTWSPMGDKFAVPGMKNFGWDVALSADGLVALVGVPGDMGVPGGGLEGTALVFSWKNGTWNGTGALGVTEAAPSNFGCSVSLSAEGTVALVGASTANGGPGRGKGAAYVFTIDSSKNAWVWQNATPKGLTLPDGIVGFGHSVALSADGDVALVGCYPQPFQPAAQGAWVFSSVKGVWDPSSTRLSPAAVNDNASFGMHVALSADGTTALVSDVAGGNDIVAAWIFTNSGSQWTPQPNMLLGSAASDPRYSTLRDLALSADGHTAIMGGYGNTGDPQGAWLFDNDTRVISHIFVLMLENHSFDNIFAFSGIQDITTGGSGSSNSIRDPVTGVTTVYSAAKPAPVQMSTDPGHEFSDTVEQLCGAGTKFTNGQPYPTPINNSGFAYNYKTTRTEINAVGNPSTPTPERVGDIMLGFDTPRQLPVIHALATNYALCDHWFSSLPGPTFPNRAFLHGGSSSGWLGDPKALWEASGFQYAHGSIFDALTSAGINWRVYHDRGTGLGTPAMVTLIKGITPFDVESFTNFAADVTGPNYPEGYTFIEPNFGDVVFKSFKGGSSQHPMDGTFGGENLIKQTYEAIRQSPYWATSLLIVTYDEHGGFYDSVAPRAAPSPGDGNRYNEAIQFQFDRYGVRVPAVVVSPLIAQGVVDDTVYDHTSVIATMTELFGTRTLTARDRAANSLHYLLTGSPRVSPLDAIVVLPDAVPDPSPPPASPSPTQTVALATAVEPGQQPVPTSGNVPVVLQIMKKTEMELSDGSDEAKAAIQKNVDTIKTLGDAQAYMDQVNAKIEAARSARKR